jgi:hypothetical protein
MMMHGLANFKVSETIFVSSGGRGDGGLCVTGFSDRFSF